MDSEVAEQPSVVPKTKRSLSFSPGGPAAAEQPGLGAAAGAEVPEPVMAPARKVKLDPLARAGLGSTPYSMSPQYKMPWQGRREGPDVAHEDKAQPKGPAASLSARFQSAPALQALGELPGQQTAENDKSADVGCVEAEQRGRERGEVKASPSVREDPCEADGRSEGEAQWGCAVGASVRSSLSDTSIVQRANHLALDAAEEGEEVEKQQDAIGPASSSRMVVDFSGTGMGQHSGIEDFLQAATKAAPARNDTFPEKWREDPVFQGMEYVGCQQQYTARHYERFLSRQAQAAEAAAADV